LFQRLLVFLGAPQALNLMLILHTFFKTDYVTDIASAA